ncbi:SNF2 family helicase [Hirsutella rhossiliensis]|uniref:SNF2 family helicase n=1 Tax=Hirsutella rhossiliensis TaxID=111463 RepID=A0A9P8N2Q9_9HYPO|nr:SNF2 family helicase [Hirsutella rhossiliensis]KAH0967208.1 SNF2 family helicase [Hirsutella rhossiliensis]
MHLSRDRFVPAGSLSISQDEAGLVEELWSAPYLQSWNRFCQVSPLEARIEAESNSRHLPRHVQECLFKTESLRALLPLFRARWIDLELRVSSRHVREATVRVYLLPDDAYRDVVDRSHPSLIRSRKQLLRALDYSKVAWQGDAPSSPTGLSSLLGFTQHDDSQDDSLLQVFNRIPSPSPDPNLVNEYYLQSSMYDVLNSVVSGLKTQLHPYQRRSTALMLQRESNPGKVLDPRLVTAESQAGSPWYLDPMSGTVLAEPRFYDGISGGILAEEMGSGKTIICLVLILATRDFPTKPPELYSGGKLPVRAKIASLADMAASCVSRHAIPWRPHLGYGKAQFGYEFTQCAEVIRRNPAYYQRPAVQLRRGGRRWDPNHWQPTTIYLSPASVVIVPNNLVAQWLQEIDKHTMGLRVVVLTRDDTLPEVEDLLEYDMMLFSQSRFERIAKERGGFRQSSLACVHFKRCIVDEGHKLGNSRIGHRSNLLIGLDAMNFSSRWIVTGTPSHGLFGVDDTRTSGEEHDGADGGPLEPQDGQERDHSPTEMEKKDLQRLGSIASLYLKARPWANAPTDAEDARADWNTYLLLPKHNPRSYGRWDSLESTLSSLIIRHRLAEVGDLLPPVNEKIILLDGSYQDRLSLNIFAMMIIFNSVQSQRTDVDYFFHVRQRKSLLQIVHNLKQTSFFGGSFFSSGEIAKAVETAEDFLREKKVPISTEDESLLREAIDFGRLAIQNKLRGLSNQFHEVPVCVEEFPGHAGQSWSLDGKAGDTVCTSPSMLLSLQKLLRDAAGSPEQLNSLLNGRLILEGRQEKDRILAAQGPLETSDGKGKRPETLAGNTKLGSDSPRKARSHGVGAAKAKETVRPDDLPAPLQLAKITSTVSAKLSYLIDSIAHHQEHEKMIVFYENENVAWYLASMLDVFQIQHLIYAKGLTSERRGRYVDTFHSNPAFRVLLMDLSQAAFGLDMREASRIYFINPVLNPQVEAQAIGRVRRISQQRPVSVETLVLRNSIDEVILERKKHMSQAEHRQVKSILDIRPIYNWIKNARVVELPDMDGDGFSEMAQLSPVRKGRMTVALEAKRSSSLPEIRRGCETLSHGQHDEFGLWLTLMKSERITPDDAGHGRKGT